MKIDDKEAARLAGLCEPATPGPWTTEMGSTVQAPSTVVAYECPRPDQLFIAASRTAVPDLLSDRAALLDAVRMLREALAAGGDCFDHAGNSCAEWCVNCKRQIAASVDAEKALAATAWVDE